MTRIEPDLPQVMGQLLQLVARIKDLLTLRIPNGERTRAKSAKFSYMPLTAPMDVVTFKRPVYGSALRRHVASHGID